MKVEISPQLYPHRGGEVEVGNVYSNPHASGRFFRVVVGIAKKENDRPWNCVVCVHVDAFGNIAGSSNQPLKYMSEHQNLVGKVVSMPTLKIKWLRRDGNV